MILPFLGDVRQGIQITVVREASAYQSNMIYIQGSSIGNLIRTLI